MKNFIVHLLLFLLLLFPSSYSIAKQIDHSVLLAKAVAEISAENSGVVSHKLFVGLSLKDRNQFYDELPENHQFSFWRYRLSTALESGQLNEEQKAIIYDTLKVFLVLQEKQISENEFQEQLKALEARAIKAYGEVDATRLFTLQGELFRGAI